MTTQKTNTQLKSLASSSDSFVTEHRDNWLKHYKAFKSAKTASAKAETGYTDDIIEAIDTGDGHIAAMAGVIVEVELPNGTEAVNGALSGFRTIAKRVCQQPTERAPYYLGLSQWPSVRQGKSGITVTWKDWAVKDEYVEAAKEAFREVIKLPNEANLAALLAAIEAHAANIADSLDSRMEAELKEQADTAHSVRAAADAIADTTHQVTERLVAIH